jgi:Coenzyme PQQ synthesis protein D (PqqD)
MFLGDALYFPPKGGMMPAIPATIKFVSDDDGTTLLDLSNDRMIALNETGALIWRCLARGEGIGQCVDEFASATDVSAEIAARDVHDFLQEMKRQGLLVD